MFALMMMGRPESTVVSNWVKLWECETLWKTMRHNGTPEVIIVWSHWIRVYRKKMLRNGMIKTVTKFGKSTPIDVVSRVNFRKFTSKSALHPFNKICQNIFINVTLERRTTYSTTAVYKRERLLSWFTIFREIYGNVASKNSRIFLLFFEKETVYGKQERFLDFILNFRQMFAMVFIFTHQNEANKTKQIGSDGWFCFAHNCWHIWEISYYFSKKKWHFFSRQSQITRDLKRTHWKT